MVQVNRTGAIVKQIISQRQQMAESHPITEMKRYFLQVRQDIEQFIDECLEIRRDQFWFHKDLEKRNSQ